MRSPWDENSFVFTIEGNGTRIPVPEINIKQSSTNIPSITGSYDFGDVVVGSSSAAISFTVENLGTADLNLTESPKVSINASEFSVGTQPSSPIAAGGSKSFTVTFSPTSVGAKTAMVSIANDDSDENPYTFTVTGTGTAPEINVKQGTTDIPSGSGIYGFGSVSVGSSSAAISFTVENLGTADLNLTESPKVSINASEFSVGTQPSSPIAAGGSKSFTVTFSPTSVGAKTAMVSIANDDSDENPYTFTVTGNGNKKYTTEIQKLLASDAGADDLFGNCVGTSGDYTIVGAPMEDARGSDAGAAYIFYRTGTNSWDSGTKIVASDAAAGDNFGVSVAISGDYAIVGADEKDTLYDSFVGAAYIFYRTRTNSWDSGTKIVASDAADWDFFGASVSISGSYAIVGAFGDDDGGSNSGSAYIFRRIDTNSWGSGYKIVASDPDATDYFGTTVSISGSYAIVGAYYEDTWGSDAGAAYIFNRKGLDSWDLLGYKIVAPDAEASDYFGVSVAIWGNYAIIGAFREDTLSGNAGAAYVFGRTGTNSWDSGTKITASDAEADDEFGRSVAISSDYAIVGAYWEDTGGLDAGAAYIFK